ncbi:MAG TPA: hypothetical protein VGJ70_05435 [Solirubrobacteraceae bacterium]
MKWFLRLAVAAIALASPGVLGASHVAVAPVEIAITPAGPSPQTVTVGPFLVSRRLPVFQNKDTRAHEVVFANGRCTFTLQPGERGFCPDDGLVSTVGTYRYSVAETADPAGAIDVPPAMRRVSISAELSAIRPGAYVRLRGTETFAFGAPVIGDRSGQPVTVLRRLRGDRRFRTFARVSSTIVGLEHGVVTARWSLRVRPRATTTFRARVFLYHNVWQKAESGTVTIRVRRT